MFEKYSRFNGQHGRARVDASWKRRDNFGTRRRCPHPRRRRRPTRKGLRKGRCHGWSDDVRRGQRDGRRRETAWKRLANAKHGLTIRTVVGTTGYARTNHRCWRDANVTAARPCCKTLPRRRNALVRGVDRRRWKRTAAAAAVAGHGEANEWINKQINKRTKKTRARAAPHETTRRYRVTPTRAMREHWLPAGTEPRATVETGKLALTPCARATPSHHRCRCYQDPPGFRARKYRRPCENSEIREENALSCAEQIVTYKLCSAHVPVRFTFVYKSRYY